MCLEDSLKVQGPIFNDSEGRTKMSNSRRTENHRICRKQSSDAGFNGQEEGKKCLDVLFFFAELRGETRGKSSVISADGRRQTQSVSQTDENMTPLKGEVFIETLDPAIFLRRDRSLVWLFKNSLSGPDICTTLNRYHCVKYSSTFL